MSKLSETIKDILTKNRRFKRGVIRNNQVETGSEIHNNVQILGEFLEGECLLVDTESGKIAIPLRLVPDDEVVSILNYRRRRVTTSEIVSTYDCCLIYSYVDLNEDEPTPVNPDVLFTVRDKVRVTYAPEAPVNAFDNLTALDNNFYGIPFRRYPYYPTEGDALNNEKFSVITSEEISFFNQSLADYLLTNGFINQVTRDANAYTTLEMRVTNIGVFNPLVPLPPSLVYTWQIRAHVQNIALDDVRVGQRIIRFKCNGKYEVELLRLHPYELYKTYIHKIGNDKFEVVVKAGIKIDYEGFPKNQYDMQYWYDQVMNHDYLNFSNDEINEKTEFTAEQLYVHKWCKGYYFIVGNGGIETQHEFTPVDDYKNFDYSQFRNNGRGLYDRVYACAAAGNWDKYDKDGNPLITQNYYGEPLTYSDYKIFNTDKHFNNADEFINNEGEMVFDPIDITQNNAKYVVQPQLFSLEYGNLYTPPNSTTIQQQIRILKLYEQATVNVDGNNVTLPVYNTLNDFDYGVDNLNSIEKNILKKNPYRNVLNGKGHQIFSNLHNTQNLTNSVWDYLVYGVNASDEFNYTYFLDPVTMDYFPEESSKQMTYFSSPKKPWEFDYYDENSENYTDSIDDVAKLEVKVFPVSNIDSSKLAQRELISIHKFDVTQKDISNVNTRGELDLDSFHIKNLYVYKL